MQTHHDYRKYKVIYVDDEAQSLEAFAGAFEDQFTILTATSARAGLALIEQHREEIGVLMTDQQMPNEKGVWLLEKVRQLEPRIVRILATAYTDLEAAIAAVNSGAIYKYIHKPFDMPLLETTLKRALDFYILQRERDQLLHEKLSMLHNMMIADRIVSLGLLAAGLSHHIRNSLVAVKTFLDLAPAKMEQEKKEMDGLRDPDFWKEYYHNVQAQITKINNLLKDLWAVSEKPTASFADQVELRPLVTGVVEGLRASLSAKNLTVENNIPADLPLLTADRPKIERLFELLLRDEIATLPEGSRMELAASVANGRASDRREIQITLTDNGPGLPKEAVRLVFDPFVVRADSPMEYGINLMACYFIVHHHGGRIEARSDGDRGTTFTVRLPVNPAAAGSQQQEADFLQKVVLNDSLWQKLISSD